MNEDIIKEEWFEIGKSKVRSNIKPDIERGVSYFICVTAPYNYVTCLRHNLWGVEPHNQKIIGETSPDGIPDGIIIFYIKSEKKFGVVCRVTSNVFYDNSHVWRDGIYPYRIQIEPLFSPQYPKEIDQNLIEDLDFMTRKDNRWGCVLQRSMLKIPENDFSTILDYLED